MKTAQDIKKELQLIYREVEKKGLSPKSVDKEVRKRYADLKKKADFLKPLLFYLEIKGVDVIVRMRKTLLKKIEINQERVDDLRRSRDYKTAAAIESSITRDRITLNSLDYIVEPKQN